MCCHTIIKCYLIRTGHLYSIVSVLLYILLDRDNFNNVYADVLCVYFFLNKLIKLDDRHLDCPRKCYKQLILTDWSQF